MSNSYRFYASRAPFWASVAGVLLLESFLHHVTRKYGEIALIAAPFVTLLTVISTSLLVYALYNWHIRGPGRNPIVELNDDGIAHRGRLVAKWTDIDSIELVERHQGWEGLQNILRIKHVVGVSLVSEVELKVTCIEGKNRARNELLVAAGELLLAARKQELAALKAELEAA